MRAIANPLRSRFEFRVNHIVSAARRALSARTLGGASRSASRGARITGRGQPRTQLLQVARQLAEPRDVGRVVFDHLPDLTDHSFGARAFINGSAVAQFADLAFDLISDRIGLIARVNLFAPSSVFIGVTLRVSDHAPDLVFGELGRAGDRDPLLFSGGFVLSRRGQDSVGVYVEADLDLRQSAWRGRDAFEPEMAQRAVVARQFAFALKYVNVNRILIVFGGRKDFRTTRGDGRIALDQFGRHAAERLHTQ